MTVTPIGRLTFLSPRTLCIAQKQAHAALRYSESGATVGPDVQRNVFLALTPDGCGASSSNWPVLCGSVCRTRDNPGVFLPGILGRRGLRGRPSCGSRDGASRKLGRKLPAVLQRLQQIRLPQERPLEIARL